MSTSMVSVAFNASMIMFVARMAKIRMAMMGEDQVTAAMAPQPTSSTSS